MRNERLRIDDLEQASDAALVVAVGRFRGQALAEIYRRHGGAIFALAQRLLGERFLAEEIVQEAFLHLWRLPERFEAERGSLRSYLLAIAHARSVDLLRSEGARRNREEREARSRAEAGYDLEREVWDMTVAGRVRDALELLPEGERRAIILAYFGGHTYRDVARLLGAPEGTVKSRISAGLRRMREALAETEIESSWTES